MNSQQRHALTVRETDINGAMQRCNGNEELYASYLVLFYKDITMQQLCDAVAAGSWNDAFTAAHALKGLAGNLGFVPLMLAVGQLVIMIRDGRIHEAKEQMTQVTGCYRSIADAIFENFISVREEKTNEN